jgi:Ca-activated chloride channel family protein
MHWQAPAVLEQILDASRTTPPPPPTAEDATPATGADDPNGAVFRSDVRMVNMVVAVTDAKGEPATDLGEKDFEIIENGQPQRVTFAGSDNVPFNLAILLDLSGSTQPDRSAMISAAKRFVSLAGPQDRVAVYALAGDSFHVISNLTGDSKKLLETIERLPDVSGASPVYDAIVLSYAEDLHKRPGERNALVVISDGIDNQVSGQQTPSKVKLKQLLKAAEEMHALVYPVFLLSGERFGRNWSKKAQRNMQELADASGGRLFPAESIQDLEPVFPLVEAELRSVYSVAYYPENQNFEGGWRSVQVKVKGPGMKVRARPGYYAK